jgi:hypothetical protein
MSDSARKAAMQAARKLMYALDVAELDASAFQSFEAGINALTRQISAANHAAELATAEYPHHHTAALRPTALCGLH